MAQCEKNITAVVKSYAGNDKWNKIVLTVENCWVRSGLRLTSFCCRHRTVHPYSDAVTAPF